MNTTTVADVPDRFPANPGIILLSVCGLIVIIEQKLPAVKKVTAGMEDAEKSARGDGVL
jgi:hypothetical protein